MSPYSTTPRSRRADQLTHNIVNLWLLGRAQWFCR